MKKAEVVIGGHYVAKVSQHLTIVKIVSNRMVGQWGGVHSGWYAVNIRTGKEVLIRTAARLRRVATTEQIYARGGQQLTYQTIGTLLN